MTLLIILALSFGASLKAVLQSRFGKKHIKTTDDAIAFNGLIFVSAAVVASIFGNLPQITLTTLVAGCFFGVASVVFQLTYLKAMSEGPVSMTVLFSNFGMMIPMLVAIIFYDERITGIKIIGFILVCISIILNALIKEEQKATGKWLLFAFLTLFSSGALLTVQKVFTNTKSGKQIFGFIAVAYIFASLLSALIYLFRKETVAGKRTFEFGGSVVLTATVIGAILSAVQIFLTWAIDKLGALILLPGYNGGTAVTMFFIGAVLYKEKHTAVRWISAFLGVVAIILLSI